MQIAVESAARAGSEGFSLGELIGALKSLGPEQEKKEQL